MTTAGRKHLVSIVQQAAALVDEETAILRKGQLMDHGPYVVRKNTIAFELENIARLVEAVVPDTDLKHRLRALKDKLEENSKLLQVHVSASHEIVNILSELQKSAESDGTYFVRKAHGRKST